MWPSIGSQRDIMDAFKNGRSKPFPHVVGCVDGTHLKIPTPKEDAVSYPDRKGNYSIIMQAICDSKFRFLDVFTGYPGSCHDANVWNSGPIYKGITSGQVRLVEAITLVSCRHYHAIPYDLRSS